MFYTIEVTPFVTLFVAEILNRNSWSEAEQSGLILWGLVSMSEVGFHDWEEFNLSRKENFLNSSSSPALITILVIFRWYFWLSSRAIWFWLFWLTGNLSALLVAKDLNSSSWGTLLQMRSFPPISGLLCNSACSGRGYLRAPPRCWAWGIFFVDSGLL